MPVRVIVLNVDRTMWNSWLVVAPAERKSVIDSTTGPGGAHLMVACRVSGCRLTPSTVNIDTSSGKSLSRGGSEAKYA